MVEIFSLRKPAARIVLAFAVLLLTGGRLPAAEALPPSPDPHYVLDQANWLSPSEYSALDAKLERFERDSSSQIVVAIFPKLPQGAELFDFSQRLYAAWKLGGEKQDNGAIFLIFAADRKMRIHTGYGLEGALPDARAKQIIADRVAPLLRENRRADGVNAGVDAMIAATRGEYQGDGSTNLDRQGNGSPGWVFFLFLGVIVFGPILRRLFGGDRVYSDRGVGRSPWIGGGWGGGGGGFGGGGGGGGFSGGGGSSGGGGASGGW